MILRGVVPITTHHKAHKETEVVKDYLKTSRVTFSKEERRTFASLSPS